MEQSEEGRKELRFAEERDLILPVRIRRKMLVEAVLSRQFGRPMNQVNIRLI